MHSGKDSGLSGAFGVGTGQGPLGGGSLVERNLNRWTVLFAVLFVINTIVLIKISYGVRRRVRSANAMTAVRPGRNVYPVRTHGRGADTGRDHRRGPGRVAARPTASRAGIEAVILEARSREYVEARIRAGVLEQGTVDVLHAAGVADRLDREGLRHGGIYLSFDAARHHVPMEELTGGRAVTVYGQTEVVKDLIAARLAESLPLRFDAADVRIEDFDRESRSCATATRGASTSCART